MQAVPVASVTPDLPAAQSLAPEAAPQRKARARSIFAAQAARRLMIIWGSNVCACVRMCKRVCGGHEKMIIKPFLRRGCWHVSLVSHADVLG